MYMSRDEAPSRHDADDGAAAATMDALRHAAAAQTPLTPSPPFALPPRRRSLVRRSTTASAPPPASPRAVAAVRVDVAETRSTTAARDARRCVDVARATAQSLVQQLHQRLQSYHTFQPFLVDDGEVYGGGGGAAAAVRPRSRAAAAMPRFARLSTPPRHGSVVGYTTASGPEGDALGALGALTSSAAWQLVDELLDMSTARLLRHGYGDGVATLDPEAMLSSVIHPQQQAAAAAAEAEDEKQQQQQRPQQQQQQQQQPVTSWQHSFAARVSAAPRRGTRLVFAQGVVDTLQQPPSPPPSPSLQQQQQRVRAMAGRDACEEAAHATTASLSRPSMRDVQYNRDRHGGRRADEADADSGKSNEDTSDVRREVQLQQQQQQQQHALLQEQQQAALVRLSNKHSAHDLRRVATLLQRSMMERERRERQRYLRELQHEEHTAARTATTARLSWSLQARGAAARYGRYRRLGGEGDAEGDDDDDDDDDDGSDSVDGGNDDDDTRGMSNAGEVAAGRARACGDVGGGRAAVSQRTLQRARWKAFMRAEAAATATMTTRTAAAATLAATTAAAATTTTTTASRLARRTKAAAPVATTMTSLSAPHGGRGVAGDDDANADGNGGDDAAATTALHEWLQHGWRTHTHRHEQAALVIACAYRCYRARVVVRRLRYARVQRLHEALRTDEEARREWLQRLRATEVRSVAPGGVTTTTTNAVTHATDGGGGGDEAVAAAARAGFVYTCPGVAVGGAAEAALTGACATRPLSRAAHEEARRRQRALQWMQRRLRAVVLLRRARQRACAQAAHELRSYAALTVQRVFRGYCGRLEARMRRDPALRLQREEARRWRAAVRVQAWWRATRTRRRVHRVREAVQVLQRAMRCSLARRHLHRLRAARWTCEVAEVRTHAQRVLARFYRRHVARRRRGVGEDHVACATATAPRAAVAAASAVRCDVGTGGVAGADAHHGQPSLACLRRQANGEEGEVAVAVVRCVCTACAASHMCDACTRSSLCVMVPSPRASLPTPHTSHTTTTTTATTTADAAVIAASPATSHDAWSCIALDAAMCIQDAWRRWVVVRHRSTHVHSQEH